MRFTQQQLLAATIAAQTAAGLNVLVGNDDGYAAANIRELYRLLKAEKGYNVVMVAPVVDNSGQGGRSVFDSSPTLRQPGEYGLAAVGAPSLGTDPNDSHIWYYNGTPAACTFVGLDYVYPKVFPGESVDLFVSGPNVGSNLGPFLYTLSGTIGSTYAAVGRGVPGIAFSGGSLYGQRSYLSINKTTPTGAPDPATVYAQKSVALVKELVKHTKPGQPLLPTGYGLSVNYPSITSLTNASCVDPPFVQTRMTGGAFTDRAVYNATSNTFTYGNDAAAGVNACINGDCGLPGETTVVNAGCRASVSVFAIDYDAPSGKPQRKVRDALEPLVAFEGHHYKPRSLKETEKTSPLRHE